MIGSIDSDEVTELAAPFTNGGALIGDPGANDTKGAWVQVIASTAREYHALDVNVLSWCPVNSSGTYSIDIGLGGAGSEQVIIPDLFGRWNSSSSIFPRPHGFPAPVSIPAGSRLSARLARNAATVNAEVMLQGRTRGFQGIPQNSAAIQHGFNATGTVGTAVTGGAANTKGAWSQIAAATAVPVRALLVQMSPGSGPQSCLVDVGIGGAGSEQVLFPDITYANTTTTCSFTGLLLPCQLPAGVRLAMRLQSTIASGAVYACLMGFP